jgi:nucleoside-diphosphate-sugar epimerase
MDDGVSIAALDEELSRPSGQLTDELARLPGDILVLGAGGKMGPTLARMAVRASRSGPSRRVIAAARFSNRGLPAALEEQGVETVRCDLFDRRQVEALPEAPNVIYMVGQKFGTSRDAGLTWASNAWLPAVIAERYPEARLVAFSTGNVYPLSPVTGEGPSEHDPVGPIGEYAQSALARERILEFFSRRNGTRVAILRLNYAVEPRYGVLRDIAERVRAGQPVKVTMGWVNLIWQRDANEIALRSLAHCEAPPLVLNLTGYPKRSVRWIAEQFAARWGVVVRFEGEEAPTALLSDARALRRRFGEPPTDLDTMIARVADWMERGGESLGKPTHFEMREGSF